MAYGSHVGVFSGLLLERLEDQQAHQHNYAESQDEQRQLLGS
ncbi:MAG: hypothetical protein ACM37Z_17020 [Deltaproteobacteria bacterium]